MSATITKGYAPTSAVQVHFRACGQRRPAAVPLVLLHQTASSSVMFEGLMGELAGEYWMFAPDTPGFGGTDALAETGTVARYAAVIVEALRRVEIQRCHLFGHHSGASIAVQIARDCPDLVDRLVLSGPPYLTREQIEGLIPMVCPVELDPDGAHLMAVWRRIRAKDPDAPVALTHREAVLNLHAGVRYPEAYRAVFEHDLPGLLAALEHRTLVMAGPDDTIAASLEPAYRALRRGAIKRLPRGGTYICDREPAVVAQALREFLGGD